MGIVRQKEEGSKFDDYDLNFSFVLSPNLSEKIETPNAILFHNTLTKTLKEKKEREREDFALI